MPVYVSLETSRKISLFYQGTQTYQMTATLSVLNNKVTQDTEKSQGKMHLILLAVSRRASLTVRESQGFYTKGIAFTKAKWELL